MSNFYYNIIVSIINHNLFQLYNQYITSKTFYYTLAHNIFLRKNFIILICFTLNRLTMFIGIYIRVYVPNYSNAQ